MRGRRIKFLKDITYGVSTLFLQCVIDRGGSVEEKTRLEISDTHKKTHFMMKSSTISRHRRARPVPRAQPAEGSTNEATHTGTTF